MYLLLNEGVGQTRNRVIGASPLGLGKCPTPVGDCQYPPLSIPPTFRSPSGERGQILLEGWAKKITLYHGFYTEFSRDREMDWHVHIDVPKNMKQTLVSHLRATGCEVTDKNLEDMYSELMVLDSARTFGDDPGTRNLGYRSADVSLPFGLHGSEHPAWDLGLLAARKAGTGVNFSKYSRLCEHHGYVYLQGAFVNDAYHGVLLEIHPLDSIAYAIDKYHKTISVKYGHKDWPTNFVRWRIAAFTNSALHRINKCRYLQKERTTTWYLALPSDYYNQSKTPRLKSFLPRKLWNGVSKAYYDHRGVKSFTHNLETDPRDGRKKLKVSVTMNPPDKLGGIFVRDYFIQTA